MSETKTGAPGKPAPAIRAVIAGHGDFAAGLVSAIQQITGRGNVFHTVSARDLSAAALEDLLEDAIASTGAQVVFTDLQAGSCTMAVRRLARRRPDVLLVAGANLPMLLDFVFADQLSPVEAARHALERGRAAITAMGGAARSGAPGDGSDGSDGGGAGGAGGAGDAGDAGGAGGMRGRGSTGGTRS